MSQQDQAHKHKPALINAILSALAAAIGVQSKKNLEHDMRHGRASTFIIAGILVTLVFIASVYTVVYFVTSNTVIN